MHERFGDQGLVVLAISYENKNLIENFLSKENYSVRAGSDPNRNVINAYGVSGFPSSALIGPKGKLLWKGSPYGAQRQVETALGLPVDAAGALTAYRKNGEQRAIEHLLKKATAKFDLAAWAKSVEVPALEEGKRASKMKPGAALDKAMKGQGAAIHSLREHGGTEFDLGAWARKRYEKLFPLKKAEVKAMLEAGAYRRLMEAFLLRKTSAAVMKAATKDEAFTKMCRDGADKARTLGRKGIMAKNWTFANRIPTDNEGFWRDMSVSGMATSEDKKRVVGLLIGGAMIPADGVDSYIEGSLLRHLLMQEIAKGKGAKTSKLKKKAGKMQKSILAELKLKYGWADPIQPK